MTKIQHNTWAYGSDTFTVIYSDGYSEVFGGQFGAEKARLAAKGIMQSMDENTPPIY